MRIVYVLVAVLVLKMIQNYGDTILFKFSLSFLSFPLYHIIHFFFKTEEGDHRTDSQRETKQSARIKKRTKKKKQN